MKGEKIMSDKQVVNPLIGWIPVAVCLIILKRLLMALAAVFVLGMGCFIPFLRAEAVKNEQVQFDVETTQDTNLELGESKVSQDGEAGEKQVTYQYTRSLFDIFFHKEFTVVKVVSSKISTPPINEVVVQGTKKYQYMWCSDGSSRYYTDEVFADSNTGFTHKSEDYCVKDGGGKMTKLADSAPKSGAVSTLIPKSPVLNTPSLTPISTDKPYVPSDCTTITIPFATTYQEVAYLETGKTYSIDGLDGKRFICTADSNGTNTADVTIQPMNKIVYVGTGTPLPTIPIIAPTPTVDYQAGRKCQSDYESALGQLGMLGAASGSGLTKLQSLHEQCLRRAGY